MKTGTVKFFNRVKGFGFIKEDNSEAEVFVHHSGLIDKIKENDKVEFEVEEAERGQKAVNVKLISQQE